MRTALLLPLLLFSSLILQAQNKDAIAKAEAALGIAIGDTGRFMALSNVVNAAIRTEPKRAEEAADEMIVLGKRINQPLYTYLAYAQKGRMVRKRRDYSGEIYHLDSLSLEGALGITGSKNKKQLFEALMVFSADYIDAHVYAKAEPWLERAEALATSDGDPDKIGQVAYTKANMLGFQFKNQEAVPYFRKAIAYYRLGGNELREAEAKVFFSETMKDLGRPDTAITLLFDALTYYETKMPTSNRRAGVHRRLGKIYAQQSLWPKSEEQYRLAIPMFTESKNWADVAQAQVELGEVLVSQKKYVEADTLFGNAVAIFAAANSAPNLMYVYTAMGTSATAQGRFGIAKPLFAKAMRLADSMDLNDGRIGILEAQAELANARGDKAEAERLLRKSIKLTNKVVDPKVIQAMLQNKYGIYPKDTAKAKAIYAAYGQGAKQDSLPLQALLNPVQPSVSDSLNTIALSARIDDEKSRLIARIRADSIGYYIESQARQTAIIAAEKNNARLLQSLLALSVIALAGGGFTYVRIRKDRNEKRALGIELQAANRQLARVNKSITHGTGNIYRIFNMGVSKARLPDGSLPKQPTTELQSKLEALSELYDAITLRTNRDYVEFAPLVSQAVTKYMAGLAPEVDTVLELEAGLEVKRHSLECLLFLILELLTNSVKHGRPAQGPARIALSVHRHADGTVSLLYKDNGPGYPADGPARAGSHGTTQLQEMAAEAEATESRHYTDGGACFTLTLPAEAVA